MSPTVELLIAADVTYGAASGASLAMQMDFWDYCEGRGSDDMAERCYEELGVDDVYKYEYDSHQEL